MFISSFFYIHIFIILNDIFTPSSPLSIYPTQISLSIHIVDFSHQAAAAAFTSVAMDQHHRWWAHRLLHS